MSRATTRKSGETRPMTAASMITEIADGTWTCAVIDASKFGAGHDIGIAALDVETGERFRAMDRAASYRPADIDTVLAALIAFPRRRHFDRGDPPVDAFRPGCLD